MPLQKKNIIFFSNKCCILRADFCHWATPFILQRSMQCSEMTMANPLTLFFQSIIIPQQPSCRAAQSSILYWVTLSWQPNKWVIPLLLTPIVPRCVSETQHKQECVSELLQDWTKLLCQSTLGHGTSWGSTGPVCLPRDMHMHRSMTPVGRQGLRSKSNSQETVMISSSPIYY